MPAKVTGLIGKWAFVIGVVIAILVGIAGTLTTTAIAVLAVLGLIVGLLNITAKEASPFLLAGIALVIISALGKNVMGTIAILGNILDSIMVLIVPATIIVALKEVFSIAKA